MIKKKVAANDSFQKSIESTAKVTSEDKNLNVFFGESVKKNKTDIFLPVIDETSDLKDIEKIRGMSDSASLIRKYHDFDLHKRLSPIKDEYKKIFDELEIMRCEVLGSLNMPGIKKNISDLLELEIKDEKKNIKISKEKNY